MRSESPKHVDPSIELCVAERAVAVLHGDRCVHFFATHARRGDSIKDLEQMCDAVKSKLSVGDLYDLCAAESAVEHAFWKRVVEDG